MMIDQFDLNTIVVPLHTWFAGHARVLPWRDDPTPYRVWISEIMLQQTRVEAVKPYYERFMTALPTVQELAACPDDQLMKLWEGLGYYNRARNLKVAANQIIDTYGGELPGSYEELLKLKGIGHYTAGAVSSIAFGLPVPAVDGNVLRVISRVTGDDSDIMKQSVRTHMEELLREVMEHNPHMVPKVFNQALMEIGAIVCVPNGEPLCEKCPLHDLCEARKQNRIAELPVKKKAKARRIEDRTVLIVRDGAKVAIHKRPGRGLLAGLYELPNYETHMDPDAIVQQVERMGYAPLQILPLADAKHIFSHVEWHMKGYVLFVEDRQLAEDASEAQQTQVKQLRKEAGWLFLDVEDVQKNYAIPSAFSKYMEYIGYRMRETK